MRRLTLLAIPLIALLPTVGAAENLYLDEGLEAVGVSPEFLQNGGQFAADPADADSFFLTSGVFQVHQVWKISVGDDGSIGSSELVADGTSEVNSDNRCEDHFGSPVLIPMDDGRLVVADEEYGTGGMFGSTLGEAILVGEDLNSDGDFLEAGEWSVLSATAPWSSPDFTCTKGTEGPDGRIFLTTEDLFGNGEVLAVDADGSDLVNWLPGLDRGYGVAFLSDGRAVIADTNSAFNAARLLVAEDSNMDGVITAGELTEAISGLPPITHIGVSGEGALYVAFNAPGMAPTLERVDVDTGTRAVVFRATELLGSFNNFISCFAFDSSGGSFAGGSATQRLLIHDYSNGLQILRYSPGVGANGDKWIIY